MRSRLRLGLAVAGLVCAAVFLTSCSPVTSAVIRLSGDGDFLLSAREECEYVVDHVEVRYLLDDVSYDDMPVLWTADVVDNGGSRQVRLLEPNDGYEVQQVVSEVDHGREVIVGWSKQYPDGAVFATALGGVLDELNADNLIWFGGLTSVADYEWQRAIPWNSWDC